MKAERLSTQSIEVQTDNLDYLSVLACMLAAAGAASRSAPDADGGLRGRGGDAPPDRCALGGDGRPR